MEIFDSSALLISAYKIAAFAGLVIVFLTIIYLRQLLVATQAEAKIRETMLAEAEDELRRQRIRDSIAEGRWASENPRRYFYYYEIAHGDHPSDKKVDTE